MGVISQCLNGDWLEQNHGTTGRIHDTVLLITDNQIMKDRGHDRLMSNFGPFFIFGQIFLIFGV